MTPSFDINRQDTNGVTALMMAAISKCSLEVFKTLCLAGADVNLKDKEGLSVMFWLLLRTKPDPQIILLLLQYGFNLKIPNWRLIEPYMSLSKSIKERILFTKIIQHPTSSVGLIRFEHLPSIIKYI